MANIRPKDLPNANSAADSDELIIDGSAGVRRLAYGELRTQLAGEYQAAPDTYKLAPLDTAGKLPSARLPDSISAGLVYKGTVAGNSVPAASDSKGDFYLITSAGSSRGKTWAIGDMAIYTGVSGAWDQVPEGVVGISGGGSGAITAAGARANLGVLSIEDTVGRIAAVTGGIILDGITSGTRVTGRPANEKLRSSDFTLWCRFKAPVVNPGGYAFVFGLSGNATVLNDAHSASFMISSSGALTFRTVDAAYGVSSVSLADFVANYAGKVVGVLGVREGSTMTLWVNSIQAAQATGQTVRDVNPSIAYWHLGTDDTARYGGEVYRAGLLNLALTAAEVDELLSSGVPDRFKWGTRVARHTSDFSSDLDGWQNIANGSSAGYSAPESVGGESNCLKITFPASETHRPGRLGLLTKAKAYRVTGKCHRPAASASFAKLGAMDHADKIDLPADTWVSFAFTRWVRSTATTMTFTLCDPNGAEVQVASGESVYFKEVVLEQVGAVLDPDLLAGKGTYLPDRSSNGYWGEANATTGVAHKLERRYGEIQIVKTLGHSDISATADTTKLLDLPANCGLLEVEFDREAAFDAGSNLSIGPGGANTKHVSAQAADATGKVLADSASKVSESASSWTSVYIKKNQATTQGQTTVRARLAIRG